MYTFIAIAGTALALEKSEAQRRVRLQDYNTAN